MLCRKVNQSKGPWGWLGRGFILHRLIRTRCLCPHQIHMLLSHFSRVPLCVTRDGSPSGSTVPGILQARTLEWVAISFSNAWKWKVKVKSLSRVRLLATPWTAAYQAPLPMGFSRQEYWSGLPSSFATLESEKWKGSRSVVSNSLWPHGLQPSRLLHPWDAPGKSTGVGCHCLVVIEQT